MLMTDLTAIDLEPAVSELVFVVRWTPTKASADLPTVNVEAHCLLLGEDDRLLEIIDRDASTSGNLSAVFDVGYARAGGSVEAGRIYLFLNDLSDDAESAVLYLTTSGPWLEGGNLSWHLLEEAQESMLTESTLEEIADGHSQIAVQLLRADDTWKIRNINSSAPANTAEDVLSALLAQV